MSQDLKHPILYEKAQKRPDDNHNGGSTEFFGKIGRALRERLTALLYGLGYFFSVLKESVLFFRQRKVVFRVLVQQILFTGYEALRVSAVLALAIGVAINLIGSSLLAEFGQGKVMYSLLIIVITRELGPLLTAFIVSARSGTAIATELGGMVVNHEIEAYVSVGVNPISYLAAPRLLGVVISMVVLSIYFNIFGLLGSFAIMQVLKPVDLREYFGGIMAALTMRDILACLGKSAVFGIIIATVSTYRGFAVERASTEVPVAGIRAVSSSFMLCIIADAVVTTMQYLG